jgi:hypothetical protein
VAQIQAQLALGMGFFFFLFLYLIYRGGHQTALKKVQFTVTFGPRRLTKMPRLSSFARLG